jgi:hypothetical protein
MDFMPKDGNLQVGADSTKQEGAKHTRFKEADKE